MKVLEKYYSIGEAALLLSCCEKTIRRKLESGEFGAAANIGSTKQPSYRIPASGINAYLDRQRVFSEPGITARSIGELRRKAAALQPA